MKPVHFYSCFLFLSYCQLYCCLAPVTRRFQYYWNQLEKKEISERVGGGGVLRSYFSKKLVSARTDIRIWLGLPSVYYVVLFKGGDSTSVRQG